MGNIESKLCEWSDSFAKPVIEGIEERIKAYFKTLLQSPVQTPVTNSVKKEIVIKCSLEEMMKVFFKDYVIVWHDPNANSLENQQYIAQLTRFCDVFTFTEWEKASAYIRETKTVCHIVTSGTNGELLVQRIFKRENVCNIYLLWKQRISFELGSILSPESFMYRN